MTLDELLVSPAPTTRNGIPRFVDEVDYAESFGEQWHRYRRVQLDSASQAHYRAQRQELAGVG